MITVLDNRVMCIVDVELLKLAVMGLRHRGVCDGFCVIGGWALSHDIAARLDGLIIAAETRPKAAK